MPQCQKRRLQIQPIFWRLRLAPGMRAISSPVSRSLWRQVDDSVSDVRVLAAEIARLRDRLNACRIDRANLAAAGRVTITAYNNGEPDPLACLRDELHAQGFGARGQGRGDI